MNLFSAYPVEPTLGRAKMLSLRVVISLLAGLFVLALRFSIS